MLLIDRQNSTAQHSTYNHMRADAVGMLPVDKYGVLSMNMFLTGGVEHQIDIYTVHRTPYIHMLTHIK